jgi:hypothetical protein
VKAVRLVSGCLTLTFVAANTVAHSAKDFPLTGSYTQNAPCKGDGSDPSERQVKLSPNKIVSHAGVCTFLKVTSEGSVIEAQLQCDFQSGPLIGDVFFTVQADNSVKFADRNQNYRSILYRCPD